MNAKEKLADYQRQFGVYAEANSEVMGAFGATVTAAMENSGSLDAKTMELLILDAAVSRKCEPCIYSHVHQCRWNKRRSGGRTECRSTDLWRTRYGIQRISTGSL